MDRETFQRLHAAATTSDDTIVVQAADVRCLLDAGAEIDRQCVELNSRCEQMTAELAEAKGKLIELAAGSVS